MRNFKDLSRALASIAGGLKGIKDIIDTIEPGGGGGSADWTLISGSGESYDTLSTTATTYDVADKTDIMLVVVLDGNVYPPCYVNLAQIAPISANHLYFRMGGSSYASLDISISDNTMSIVTTAGTLNTYVYTK